MTVILAILFGVSLFCWNDLTLAGKSLLGFVIMERFFLKTVGLTFADFRKMAMARVLGNKK